MEKFSFSWDLGIISFSDIIKEFSSEITDSHIKFYHRDKCISNLRKVEKEPFFTSKLFGDFIVEHLPNSGFNVNEVKFNMVDYQYEFQFYGECISMFNSEFQHYITLCDSIDGTISLQLNFGLIHRKTGAVLIFDYENEYSSNRWRHSKVNFNEKIKSLHKALLNYNKSFECTVNTIKKLENANVSYRKVVELLTEFDTNNNIKLGNRQKLIALNKKVRNEFGIKEDVVLKILKSPEVFNESKIDFQIPAITLLDYYATIYKGCVSSAIVRENNRILKIIFDIMPVLVPTKSTNESIFFSKTGMQFDDFYSKHFTKLTWFLARYTKDIEFAQDLANETFIHGLEKIESYDSEKSKIHTWMYKIGENIVRKYYKDGQRLSIVSFDNNTKEEVNILNIIPDKGEVGDNNALTLIEKKAQIIKDAIYSLPPKYNKYKDVLIMREFENMQYKDISDKTGINLSTVKSQIRNGRELIIKKVKKQFDKLEKEFYD